MWMMRHARFCYMLFGVVLCFWRLPCQNRAGIARIDPIMQPGNLSSHVHGIYGGDNFGFTSNSDRLRASSCSSCAVLQDKSAYWTPPLYFMFTNGTVETVPPKGQALVYYLLETGENQTQEIDAFPPGFRVVSGDATRRNFTCQTPEPEKSDWGGYELTQAALQQKALGFNCLNYMEAAEPSLGRHFLPEKEFLDHFCPDGLRTEIMFPSCWDGRSFSDPSEQSQHVIFPSEVMTGQCPAGWNRRLPSLFYEIIWNTQVFSRIPGQFLFSQGDPTGYGNHGDFMEGWNHGVLQEAIDRCTSLSGVVEDCEVFNISMEACDIQLPSQCEHEDVKGPLLSLPGDNPVQTGPEEALVAPTSSIKTLHPLYSSEKEFLSVSTRSDGLRMITAPTGKFSTFVGAQTSTTRSTVTVTDSWSSEGQPQETKGFFGFKRQVFEPASPSKGQYWSVHARAHARKKGRRHAALHG